MEESNTFEIDVGMKEGIPMEAWDAIVAANLKPEVEKLREITVSIAAWLATGERMDLAMEFIEAIDASLKPINTFVSETASECIKLQKEIEDQ